MAATLEDYPTTSMAMLHNRRMAPVYVSLAAAVTMCTASFAAMGESGAEAQVTSAGMIRRQPHPDNRTTHMEARIRSLKDRSGLSWAQLAALFGVSRRAVHHWANGGNLNAENAARLEVLTAVVIRHDRGDARQTRAHLLAPGEDGRSIYAAAVSQVAPAAPDDGFTALRQLEGVVIGEESYVAGHDVGTESIDLDVREP